MLWAALAETALRGLLGATVSTITPPVALASYVAAGIARADINKVGWAAFAYGITCYLLPFIFFYGPALLMQGSVAEILLAVGSGVVGVYCIAACVVGQFSAPLSLFHRLLMGVAGTAMLHQGLWTDLAGAGFLGLVWLMTRPPNIPEIKHPQS